MLSERPCNWSDVHHACACFVSTDGCWTVGLPVNKYLFGNLAHKVTRPLSLFLFLVARYYTRFEGQTQNSCQFELKPGIYPHWFHLGILLHYAAYYNGTTRVLRPNVFTGISGSTSAIQRRPRFGSDRSARMKEFANKQNNIVCSHFHLIHLSRGLLGYDTVQWCKPRKNERRSLCLRKSDLHHLIRPSQNHLFSGTPSTLLLWDRPRINTAWRDLRFSRRWRFKSSSSGLWCVVLW